MAGRSFRVEERAFVRAARVGRLATVDEHGFPLVVPFCFALIGEDDAPVVVSVLDEKPKRVPDRELARVRNIECHPEVAFVVDRYDEDWSQLAFVLVKGRARLVQPGESLHEEAIAALRAKYPQYLAMAIAERPVIAIEAGRITSWQASDGGQVSPARA